jgi:type III pantothenate kinase
VNAPFVAIDVGNTRTKLGLFDLDDTAAGLPECRELAIVRTGEEIPAAELNRWSEGAAAALPSIITGSHPTRVAEIIRDWSLPSVSRPVPLADRSRLPIVCDVRYPEKVGIDRLLSAIAANCLRADGCGAVIVDSGTATTVGLVNEAGVFCGGAILPGLALSARALHQYTQLLPEISLDELTRESRGPVGRDTHEAIRSGLFWGHLGAIRELSSRFEQQVRRPLKLLSGGGGALLAPYLGDFELVPHLPLKGVALIAADLLRSG